MVETAALPVTPSPTVRAVPDATEAPTFEPNTPDRFATIISGRVDRIWRSRQDEYLDFISSHRSLVLTDAHWASTNLGEKSWTSPGKHADAELLWCTPAPGGLEPIHSVTSQKEALRISRNAEPRHGPSRILDLSLRHRPCPCGEAISIGDRQSLAVDR